MKKNWLYHWYSYGFVAKSQQVFFSFTFILIFFLMGQVNWAQNVEANEFPKVFQAWADVENLDFLDEQERLARHDLVIASTWIFNIGWKTDENQPYPFLSDKLEKRHLQRAHEKQKKLKALNPNMKILCSLGYREGQLVMNHEGKEHWKWGDLPPDSSFWLRNDENEIVPGWGEDKDGDGKLQREEVENGLIDFRDEDFQKLVIKRAKALKRSGLFDGIFLDWWSETEATTGVMWDWSKTYMTKEEEIKARIKLLKGLRRAVGDDFLILVNANDKKVPQSARYINGIYMECNKPSPYEGYRTESLFKIAETLSWAHENVQSPKINCLEGWRVVEDYDGEKEKRIEERNSEENKKAMRLFTAMSMTLSNGYVLFSDDNAMPSQDHLHNWYDLWSKNMGSPKESPKIFDGGKTGVYMREFEKGYALVNLTDKPQYFFLSKPVFCANKQFKTQIYVLFAKDGEFLMKVSP